MADQTIPTIKTLRGNVGIGTASPSYKLEIDGGDFLVNTASGYVQVDESDNSLKLSDNVKIKVGTGNDLSIYHDGSNSKVLNTAGYLQVGTSSGILYLDGNNTYIRSGDGGEYQAKFIDNGATELFWDGAKKFETTTDGILLSGNGYVDLPDGGRIRAGAGYDLALWHDGTHSYITNATNSLYIRTASTIQLENSDGSEDMATFTANGAVALFHDNAKKFETNSGGITVTGKMTSTNITTGLSLEMFASGGNNFISSESSGSHLLVRNTGGANVELLVNTSEKGVIAKPNGAVELYYDNVKKFETTSAGATITGSLTVSSDLIINGTTTTIDTTNLLVEDKNIIIGNVDTPSDTTADGGGITLKGASDYTINWTNSTDSWHFNQGITVGVDDTGHDVKFFGDTAGSFMLWDASQDRLELTDDSKIVFGDGADASIWHNGTDTYFNNDTGDLIIRNSSDDKDITFQCDDGSGAVETYFFLDGSSGGSAPFTVFPDGSNLTFGDGFDLRILHNATDSHIANYGGHLYLTNYADDKDIIFQSDDGSGGNETYFYLDGSLSGGNPYTIFPDNSFLSIGTGADLQIYHNGSHSLIENVTGSLYIRNNANDQDVIFQCDDGSGGLETYFYLDGSLSSGHPHTVFPDNSLLTFGTGGSDLTIHHDGTDSKIRNQTGDLVLIQNTNDGDIVFQCDDSSGGVTEYFRVDGDWEGTQFSKGTRHFDSVSAYFGSSGDLQIVHDGSNSFIKNFVSDLKIINYADDKDIVFQSDDGSGGVETYFYLDGSKNTDGSPKTVFPDNSKLQFGSGPADLRVYHDGTDSYLQNNTGDYYIQNIAADKDIIFQADDGSGSFETYFFLDGSASSGSPYTIWPDNSFIAVGSGGSDFRLYHDGSNTYMNNGTGNLYILNNTDDGDIIFQSDDGSGGLGTYFYLDGSLADGTYLNTRFQDNSRILFGTGGDFVLNHDGTNSYIDNETGDLKIRNKANDKDMSFQCDDGNGGVTTYFYLDGSAAEYSSGTTDALLTRFPDASKIALGTGADMKLFHNGTNSYIQNETGDFRIEQRADDKDMEFYSDDGSGGIAKYFHLDGGETKTIFSKPIQVGVDDTGYDVTFFGATSGRYAIWDQANNAFRLEDHAQLRLGTGSDLRLYHTGDSYIRNYTGSLNIENEATDQDIIFRCDDGSGGTEVYFYLDGSASSGNPFTVFPDLSELAFGDSRDFRIKHTGDTYLTNYSGDFYIRQTVVDKDIIFKADDGSGGTETYFYLDGSASSGSPITKFPDNSNIALGDGPDAYLLHNGTNTVLDNYTGDLIFQNHNNDGDLVFKCDDGSGGIETYFYLDGSLSAGYPYTIFPDNSYLALGNSGDLLIYHTGTNSELLNWTGDLYIKQTSNDGNIVIQNDDGSGGLADYIIVDGSNHRTVAYKDFRFNDNVKANFGTSSDLQIYHDGSNSYIKQAVGDLYIQQQGDDKDIVFQCDDGSGGAEIYFYLDGSTRYTTFNRPTVHTDGDYAYYGTGYDLKIWHDGTNSNIQNTTGALIISNNTNDEDIIFQSDDGSGGVETYFYLDGSLSSGSPYTVFPDHSNLALGTGADCTLYHNGSHTYISNTTGSLIIQNLANDADIVFECDDGSGGNETYFYLDGSASSGNPITIFPDNSQLRFGTSGDLQIYSDNSNTIIDSFNCGNMLFRQHYADGDMTFQCDDGSGGVETYFYLDGSVSSGNPYTIFPTNARCAWGNSSELQIFHTGTDTYIANYTGPLYITNSTNDSDIIFQCDDGSGGLTEYFRIDGGANQNVFPVSVLLNDGVYLHIGTGADLQLYHDATNSNINNNTGDLHILNTADDKDILLRADDGSGGNATYIQLDGSVTRNKLLQHTSFPDGKNLIFGAGDDFQLYHDGSDSFIRNYTGSLYIRSEQDDSDVILQSDDGSGGVTAYLTLDGSGGYMWASKNLIFADSISAQFGNVGDLMLYHDGTNSYIDNGTGDLYIRVQGDNKDMVFQSDNGSGGLSTYFYLDGGSATTIFTRTATWTDNDRVELGTGSDLQLIHDGTHSYISNTTGSLFIGNSADDQDIVFSCDDGSGGTEIYFYCDGSASAGDPYTKFPDNSILTFGDGGDLKVYHNATNSYIENNTGDLFIQNGANDKDIVFRCDDGSGGTEVYFYLDGSVSSGSPFTIFPDNSRLCFGTSNDLRIVHDGSNSYIMSSGAGDLYIQQHNDDKDIVFQTDDGSGGVAQYIRLDGSTGVTQIDKDFLFVDSVKAKWGAGSDLMLYHDGTDSYAQVQSGDFYIQNIAADKDIIFQADDGSGSFETYFFLDGSLSSGSPYTVFPDASYLALGTGADFRVYHDGTNSWLNNATGDLKIRNAANDKDIIFQCDDGSGGEAIYLMLDGSEERISVKKGMRFDDSVRLELGTSGDLDIYHDGSSSIIQNATGHLDIKNDANDADVRFSCDDGSNGLTEYLRLDGGTETVVINRGVTVAQRTVSGDVTVASSDYIVAFGSCSSAPTVTLPDAQRAAGRMLVFKEIDGYYNITIDPEGSTTIDGSATYTSSGTRPVIRVFSDGTNWFIM